MKNIENVEKGQRITFGKDEPVVLPGKIHMF